VLLVCVCVCVRVSVCARERERERERAQFDVAQPSPAPFLTVGNNAPCGQVKTKWDAQLASLFQAWMAASHDIYRHELWRVRLGNSVLSEEELLGREQALLLELKAKAKTKSLTTAALKTYTKVGGLMRRPLWLRMMRLCGGVC
jgi:hypothetical protein